MAVEGADHVAQGATRMPILRSISGGTDIAVDRPMVLVGRHPQCDARLDSEWVSLRHCMLTGDGRDIVVRDLGSTNGTWINGCRLERGRLNSGDEVAIAHVRYRLEGALSVDATVPIPGDRVGA
jgi:pSer/pThr/pTyr-binding forkhead associated (FHA) protein